MGTMSVKSPWQDKAKLERLYVEDEMSQSEIASMFGTSQSTISRWLSRHGLKTRPSKDKITGPWRDKEAFRRLYFEKEMTIEEMADEWGCGTSTVMRWLKRHGFKSRYYSDNSSPAPFRTGWSGYEYWYLMENDDADHIRAHRALAIAEYGFDAVKGKDVHHKNGIPWDNRPENIELLTRSEHARLHNSKTDEGS